MLPLALSTIFSAGFALLIRFAQKRGANLTAVGAVNYLTAALFHLILAIASGLRMPHGASLAIGIGGGLLYATTFFLVHGLMKQRGVSVTAAVTRLSILVPVGVSVLAWGETASAIQAAGIALAVVSLPLLSIGPRDNGAKRGRGSLRQMRGRSVALLAGLFVTNGLCLLTLRAFRQTGIQGEDSLFLLVLFAAAALTACVVWLLQERGPGSRASRAADPRPAVPLLASVLPGIAIGLCNAMANRLIVAALHRLPGIVVYPFYSAVGLLITVVFSRTVWKEKIGALETVGMAFALGSIVLVNLV